MISLAVSRRFAWIEASLRYSGRFATPEKKAYRDLFGLTDSMVSRDQDGFVAAFNRQCGWAAVHKKLGRLEPCETSTPSAPVFQPIPGMTQWLEEALGSRFEAVPPLRRAEPKPEVLQEVLKALHSKWPLRFQYQPRRGNLATRIASPHVIVSAAGRLHMRGWDHDRNAPRDFVLSRIVAISNACAAWRYVDRENDRDWQEHVDIEVRLREGENLAAVQPDYDLDEFGVRMMTVRNAHLPYMIDEGGAKQSAQPGAPITVRVAASETSTSLGVNSQLVKTSIRTK